MHSEGITVYMVPRRMNPDSPWGYTGMIMPEDDFDKVVDTYELYNCSYETGYKCAFYAKHED